MLENKNEPRKLQSVFYTAALMAATVGFPAGSSAAVLEEIVVTAGKREASIRDTAISVVERR